MKGTHSIRLLSAVTATKFAQSRVVRPIAVALAWP